MELVEDKDILEHLLRLEAKAATLVDEAQAEADRRISEGENLDRTRHDEAYSKKSAALEEAYIKKIKELKEDYQKQLDDYRTELNGQNANTEAFFRLADKFLAEGH